MNPEKVQPVQAQHGSTPSTFWLFDIAMENCPFRDVLFDDLRVKNDHLPWQTVK